jgi:8-oxo-dGTP pyrophosphatase MutT (NUDIX family)
MRLLKKIIHPSVQNISKIILKRKASRAIVLEGENILLLYTKRYNDFSFPGGGLDEGEDLILGLHRELAEETGARNIKVLGEFGHIDELRPHFKGDDKLIHMLSYFFICEIDSTLGESKMEYYEIDNGMEARWVNIHQAISHNKNVMASKESSMGLSIERETLVLEMVVKELI